MHMNLSAGMKSLETIHTFVCMVILAPTLTFGIQYKLKSLLKVNYDLHVLSNLIMAFVIIMDLPYKLFHALLMFFMGLEMNRDVHHNL